MTVGDSVECHGEGIRTGQPDVLKVINLKYRKLSWKASA